MLLVLNKKSLTFYHNIFTSANPFELSDSIERQINKIFSLASKFKSNAYFFKAS
jgi:hypothetical protein